jgi:hypothetical protein
MISIALTGFSNHQITQAHTDMEQNRVSGKLVVTA